MREIGAAAMGYVEDAVRGDLRRTPAPEFFDNLRAEPIYAQGEHIMDRHPDRFGWAVWRFHADRRALSDPESPRAIECRRNRAGAVYFKDADGPGLHYGTSGFYCAQRLGAIQQAYLAAGWADGDVDFAVTFGIADSATTPEDGAVGAYYRSKRHFPMCMCIPAAHHSLKQRMQHDWGFGVFPAMNPQVFHDLELITRKKLVGCRRLDTAFLPELGSGLVTG
jgi:hypothetical protein